MLNLGEISKTMLEVLLDVETSEKAGSVVICVNDGEEKVKILATYVKQGGKSPNRATEEIMAKIKTDKYDLVVINHQEKGVHVFNER